jgi:ABC-type glycerol-3-phosphate transport system permease component
MATVAGTTAGKSRALSGELPRRSVRRISAGNAILLAVLVLYGVFSLAPFVYAMIASFETATQVEASIPVLIPNPATLKNYHDTFFNQLVNLPFPRFILNSLIYASVTAFLNVILGAMAGYAFGRLNFPGKNILFALTLGVLMIPGYLIMIPKFLVANSLGLTNNYLALIIPAAVTPTAVFLMTQFLKTLPRELEESAMIDGASRFRAFWQIIFPLIRPAIITVAIFQFQAAWNDFMWPLLVMSDPSNYTLTVGLTFFKGTFSGITLYGYVLAGATVNIVPLVVIFFFFQRYFMQGSVATGLAGR